MGRPYWPSHATRSVCCVGVGSGPRGGTYTDAAWPARDTPSIPTRTICGSALPLAQIARYLAHPFGIADDAIGAPRAPFVPVVPAGLVSGTLCSRPRLLLPLWCASAAAAAISTLCCPPPSLVMSASVKLRPFTLMVWGWLPTLMCVGSPGLIYFCPNFPIVRW